MGNEIFALKLTGSIYPTTHPIICIREEALNRFIEKITNNHEEVQKRGRILGEKRKTKFDFEITEFSTATSPDNVIGQWSALPDFNIVIKFNKLKSQEFIWDINNENIQYDSKEGRMKSKRSFGYFIKKVIDSLVQEVIPETDDPAAPRKVKIEKSDLQVEKSNIKSSNHSQKIKVSVPKPDKIRVNKDEIDTRNTKLSPFFDDSYYYRPLNLNPYSRSYGNYSLVKSEIKRYIKKIIIHGLKNSPYFIFVAQDVIDKIYGNLEDMRDSLGIFQGILYYDTIYNFPYLEINDVFCLQVPDNFFYSWWTYLEKGFEEKEKEGKSNLTGWFYNIVNKRVENIENITERARDWHYKTIQKSSDIGFILFNQDRRKRFRKYVLFCYDFGVKSFFTYDSECYSFVKKK